MFRRMRESFQRFMYGRNGTDQLNMLLLCVSVLISLINSLLAMFLKENTTYTYIVYPILWFLMVSLLGFCIFRSFSRNLYRRQRENKAVVQLWRSITDRKNKYFKCPRCNQIVRIPRGRGKVNIRCPKCDERFIRKT